MIWLVIGGSVVFLLLCAVAAMAIEGEPDEK